jgi:superfamily I DNA/RNA helicase
VGGSAYRQAERDAQAAAGRLPDPGRPADHVRRRPVDAVKVGTYKRAKGLDFAAVFLPRLPPPIDPSRFGDPVLTERTERLNRELHVAATRPRDELWLGRLGW